MSTVNTGIPHTVLLRGFDGDAYSEGVAANGNIKPGMLIERTAADAVQPHSRAGQKAAAKLFARENEITGKSIDDAYPSGDRVYFNAAESGDWVYAWLKNGESVTIGEQLQSDGAGAFEASGSDGEAIVQALQAVNNTSGSPARIKVEVL